MISRLTGQVAERGEDWLLIDVAGVGYRVTVSPATLADLAAETVTLAVETRFRDDQFFLYGFRDEPERRLFTLLQSVQGVGAKVALAILAILKPSELEAALAVQDKAAIGRAQGVGPKLAARIVNELKDRVSAPGFAPAAPADVAGRPVATGPAEDAVSALVNLGYDPIKARQAVMKATAEGSSDLAGLIRLALKELAS